MPFYMITDIWDRLCKAMVSLFLSFLRQFSAQMVIFSVKWLTGWF